MYTIEISAQAFSNINVWLVVAISHRSKEGATVEAAATKSPLRTAATTRCPPSDSAFQLGPRTHRHLIDSSRTAWSNVDRPGGAGPLALKALGAYPPGRPFPDPSCPSRNWRPFTAPRTPLRSLRSPLVWKAAPARRSRQRACKKRRRASGRQDPIAAAARGRNSPKIHRRARHHP
jgi:hypothetical protein